MSIGTTRDKVCTLACAFVASVLAAVLALPGAAFADAAPAVINQTVALESVASRAVTAPISVTAPIAVVFGGNGYDVSTQATSLTASVTFHNNSGLNMRIASLESTDEGASQVLQAKPGKADLTSQNVFSLYPADDESKKADFPIQGTATPAVGTLDIPAGGVLDCVYRLNLGDAEVKPEAADGGATIKGLANVKYTFAAVGMGTGTGSESASFYLKDNTRNQVYSLSDVKAHAAAISLGDAECKAAYEAFMANESTYECKTTWGGVVYDVRVIGINHDNKADGSGKAGLTFQLKNLLNTTASMNSLHTNSGGWGESDLRRAMNSGDIWSMVPTDLQSVIVQVNKEYGLDAKSTAATVNVSPDKLFLASYYELTGSVYDGWSTYQWLAKEGAQYEYYKNQSINNANPNSILAKVLSSSGTAAIWWERSIHPGTAGYFLSVGTSGSSTHDSRAIDSNGVCPCFCL